MGYRLVFYSDQEIPENKKIDDRLISLIGKKHPRIGYISSSSDPERIWFKHKRKYYEKLGIDLSVYFEIDVQYDPNILEQLFECDAIHLSGGNTFHFLYWLRHRGLIGSLKNYAKNGGVLIGTSAGAILLTPDINSAKLCGDKPVLGEEMTEMDSLGLVNFDFLPHINTIESSEKLLLEYSNKTGRIIYGCQDGDGIVINKGKLELYGNIVKSSNGRIIKNSVNI